MCGLCGDSKVIDANKKEDTYLAAKAIGWKKTVKRGWLCPDCQKK
jgi:hypothetical protein